MMKRKQTEPDDTSNRPLKSIIESPLVTVAIGPENSPRIFQVHQAVLVRHSKYFKASLSGGFQEAKSLRVNFYDDEKTGGNNHDPNMFAIVADWMYYKSIIGDILDEIDDLSLVRDAGTSQLFFAQLYVEADVLVMPQLKTAIAARVVCDTVSVAPNLAALKMIKQKVQSDGDLRDILENAVCRKIEQDPGLLTRHNESGSWEAEAVQMLRTDGELSFKVMKKLVPLITAQIIRPRFKLATVLDLSRQI